MATEKRLIDANALMEELSTLTMTITGLRAGKGVLREFMLEYRKSVLRIVDEAPTVDAVELPCRMGDEVWGLKDYYGRKIPKLGVVNQMYFGEDMRLCICVKNVCRGEWGKNVFATKEEAEAAIERRTDNDV